MTSSAKAHPDYANWTSDYEQDDGSHTYTYDREGEPWADLEVISI